MVIASFCVELCSKALFKVPFHLIIVLSRIKFTSGLALEFMRKLDQPMVNWICREMADGRLSRWEVAHRAGVTKQWVYELYSRYLESGKPPERRTCGCKPPALSRGKGQD